MELIKRKKWVDFGKGISIFLVLLFHSEEYYSNGDFSLSFIFSFFRMPFFFFISGYLFTSDYKNFSIRRKLKQIFRGIVWTYLIFTSIIVIPKCISNGVPIIYGVKDILLGWAAWFVAALGVAQLMFAVILYKVKNLKVIFGIIILYLIMGYYIKYIDIDKWPFHFEKSVLVVFYLGLGFFYRIYEHKLEKIINWKYLILTGFIYFSLVANEFLVIKTTYNVFWGGEYKNYPLFILYSLAGVLFMLLFVKCLKPLKMFCFIGANSLVFYYINGGTIKILRYIFNKVGLQELNLGYLGTLFMLFCSIACISVVVLFIRKYCPIVIGDKVAFNNFFGKKLNACKKESF